MDDDLDVVLERVLADYAAECRETGIEPLSREDLAVLAHFDPDGPGGRSADGTVAAGHEKARRAAGPLGIDGALANGAKRSGQ